MVTYMKVILCTVPSKRRGCDVILNIFWVNSDEENIGTFRNKLGVNLY
jgi:hypothetical protein